jgi:hypothetical protein
MGNGGRGNFLDFGFKSVFGKFQRRGAEGIRRDEISTGRSVIGMNAAHNFRVRNIVIIRASAAGEAVVLKHGTHAAVKNEHDGMCPFVKFVSCAIRGEAGCRPPAAA